MTVISETLTFIQSYLLFYTKLLSLGTVSLKKKNINAFIQQGDIKYKIA